MKVEKNESDRMRYGKERGRNACERAWKRQKRRCILTRNGSWENSLGKENRVEETGFFRNKTTVDENGEDRAVEGRESDKHFCRLTTNDAG